MKARTVSVQRDGQDVDGPMWTFRYTATVIATKSLLDEARPLAHHYGIDLKSAVKMLYANKLSAALVNDMRIDIQGGGAGPQSPTPLIDTFTA